MTRRPIFLVQFGGLTPVSQASIEFPWHPGFAQSQKRKNIAHLHAAAGRQGFGPLLEVSTKSDEPLGCALSAFNLRVNYAPGRSAPIEIAYQASKVFEHGGPYLDLYTKTPREAKRDPRLRDSGSLVGFRFGGRPFPTEPKTAFYDWLFMRALVRQPALLKAMCEYVGFTDIEFNPNVSLNCQARACATAVSLFRRGDLGSVAKSFARFAEIAGDQHTRLVAGPNPELPLF